MVTLYLEDSQAKLEKLAASLAADSPACADMDSVVHQFKGSSASIGAGRVAAACVAFRAAAKGADVGGMRTWLEKITAEFEEVRKRRGFVRQGMAANC